jgi:hypothetical protein
MIDPKYLGIPNINFSVYSPDNSREEEFQKQRLSVGFDESETWNLYSTISKFIVPRLKEFTRISKTCPPELSNEQWSEILNKMIKSFEIAIDSDFMNEEQSDEFREGFNLFNEYFFALW